LQNDSESPHKRAAGNEVDLLALNVSDSFPGHNLDGVSESGAFRIADEQVALSNVPTFMKIMQDVFLA
jgi:hypothetical protein